MDPALAIIVGVAIGVGLVVTIVLARFAMRAGERHRDLDEITSRLQNTFSALASTALRESRGDFIALAEQQLGKLNEKALGDFETRRVAVEKIVEPLKEAIEQYRLERERLEQQRSKDVGRFDGQYSDLASATARLQAETAKLVSALRSPHVRGSWGQLTLRRTAELAGMVRYCDFFEQESIQGDDGRSTPDMLVRLPRQRLVVIDSKVPLDAYLNALEATDDADRERFLASHAAQTRDHIVRLGSKEYHRQFAESPEFVVAFFPNDSVLAVAAAHDPDLVEFALLRNVVIATPASLFALLRAVEHGWRQDQLAENSRRISVLGQQLADRLAVMIDHFDRLGGALRRAVETYNETVGSLESRVLPAARRFKHLGASTREFAELKQVDIAPRSVSVRGPFEGAQEIFPDEDDLGSVAEFVAPDDAPQSPAPGDVELSARSYTCRCVVCGRQFEGSGPRAHYCSDSCRSQALITSAADFPDSPEGRAIRSQTMSDLPIAEADLGGTERSVGPVGSERIPPGGSRA